MSDELNNDTERVKAALAGAGTTTGGTFLPTDTANEIIELVYEKSWMRQLLPSVPMARDTLKIPKLTGSVGFHGIGLSAAASPSAAGVETGVAAAESRHATSEITLEMKTLIANLPIGNHLVAYGVDGLMQVLRDDIAARLAFDEELMFINGDIDTTPATNINGAYHASLNSGGLDLTGGAEINDFLLHFDGLRNSASATAVAVASGTAFAATHIASAIANLGLHASNKDDLVLLVSRTMETKMLGWSELQTIDKYGPNATIVSGEVGKVYGVRVIGTSAIPDNLSGAGIRDVSGAGVEVDQSVGVLFNTRSPIIGNPSNAARRFSIGFLDEPKSDRFVLIPREDLAFGFRHTEAICLITGLDTA